MADYIAMLRVKFSEYRRARFAGHDNLFEQRPEGDAVVFNREHVAANLLIPFFAKAVDRQRIIGQLPQDRRHRHFASMQSSQALAQSVFGTIKALGRLPLLSSVVAENGQSAFSPTLSEEMLELEKSIHTLGERPGRSTSVDVWLGGCYRVAVECKLAEAYFGNCSRTQLKPKAATFATQHCDGTYTRQRGRAAHCALTEIGVRYWNYLEPLLGWAANTDHRPCPLADTYQLVRNILAACVSDDGKLTIDSGHALLIYDQRNPAMTTGGECDRQWRVVSGALRAASTLRRMSWQALIAQWPSDEVLDWLKEELELKYGLRPI